MQNVWTVIMAGGVGSRFWPLSRARRPKQLLDLFGDGPMLKKTSDRVAPLTPPERQLVVTSTTLGAATRALLPDVPAVNVLEEPVGRNTAAAIGWAALAVRRRDPDAVLMILPADHHIADEDGFRAICQRAANIAREGVIVTVGIQPTHPETGYGYIRAGEPLVAAPGAFTVAAFKEKPDLATATRWLAEGGYLWNAGMFFAPAQLMLDELAAFEPELRQGLDALDVDAPAPDLVASVYPGLPSISVDYAVMERSSRVAVLPGAFGWSDVGSWRSLYDFRQDDQPSFAQGPVVELDGGGNVLFADGGLVATVGVSDLIVVHTPDATLVAPRESAQRLREVVDRLRALGREDLL